MSLSLAGYIGSVCMGSSSSNVNFVDLSAIAFVAKYLGAVLF